MSDSYNKNLLDLFDVVVQPRGTLSQNLQEQQATKGGLRFDPARVCLGHAGGG